MFPSLPVTIKRVPGVYVSYPFCAQKCTYCNFASGVFPRALEPRYLEALQAEMRAHAVAVAPETVYLGGGTPSHMAPESRARCSHSFPDAPGAKPPSKPRPEPSRAEKARAWAEAGINRVSLGRAVVRRSRDPAHRPQAHGGNDRRG